MHAIAHCVMLAALGIAAPLSGQTSPFPDRDQVVPLVRLTGAVRLDGRGDDPAWQAVPLFAMTVHLPVYRRPPGERTELRVAYDDEALYVLFDAFESHPGGLRASSMVRDDGGPADWVNILLDTFGDRQNGVSFSTTPAGQRTDASISNDAISGNSLSLAWNGVWDLATRREANSWHAEFRIPFSTLRFSASGGRVEFGMSVNRLVAHANERQTFPAIEPSAPLAIWKPSRWQRVSVENIRAGRYMRLTPYALTTLEGRRAPDPMRSPWSADENLEAGGDLKLAVTPGLTLDLTANTDFAETEVDDQRVNLTRFPLFFPEQRAFFVERAGIFEMRTGGPDLLFNSRRVGLTPAGEPVRLLGGARLVGRVGDWDVGLFDAQMGRNPAGVRENLGVLRVRRGLFNRNSWAGVMLTSRVTGDSTQVAIGADGDLYLGHDQYLGFAAAALTGYAGAGPDEGVLPRGALGARIERRRNRGAWYRAEVTTTGARYAPALGYVERTDVIQPYLELGYGKQVSRTGRIVRVFGWHDLAYRNADATFEGSVTAAGVELETARGYVWRVTGSRHEEDLRSGFAPSPETTIPAGRHSAGYAQLSLTAPQGPRIVAAGSLRAGEYYDGTLYTLTVAPEWRPSAHLRAAAEVQIDRLAFAPRGEKEWSHLVRLRFLASANTRLSLSTLLQVNTLAHLATANLRLRYTWGEGHDLWLVYAHQTNLDRDLTSPPAPRTARTGLTVKYTRGFGA